MLPPARELIVKCMARTRIPTPHGPAFLHIYHNNRDNKEHLAIVVDPAQFSEEPSSVPPMRSSSLDAIWDPTETQMDRITRGAYVGRLSSTNQTPSTAPSSSTQASKDIPTPLVRIHSECFTGETIGSMRCDCGEQLDEAIRLISQPITLPNSKTIPGRGAVVYLRQEGRGIGLLSKIRAYNLQDLGHDTVTANLMLGHRADERGYEIASAILKDLGMGTGGVRLLTNNPDKVEALQKEGMCISKRVPMIPRSWRSRSGDAHMKDHEHGHTGVTLIGGRAVHGQDLDKYLRTKVLRMGHMLPLYDEVEGLGIGYE
jgi:GTP cyclohydrolase II